MSLSKLRERVEDREACVLQSMGLQRVRHDLVIEQPQQHIIFSLILIHDSVKTCKHDRWV